jgi:hypothetical protein
LAVFAKNSEIHQVIENKPINSHRGNWALENAGGKYKGKSHYVIENTCRKNARNRPRHYMHENKAPRGRSPLYL